ncbi:MAG: riboflavin biosynthesis protein RibF [Clostridiales bacterium]|jgi:riboflavin kinase/FMN adenylyltransferase|nr:riboflavin biosynthesis protein RibF [Clostridiales bacterium]
MENILLTPKNRPHCALGLGFFDSLHIGHRKIIDVLKSFALTNETASAIVTFSDNPKQNGKLVYTLEERVHLLKKCGIDYFLPLKFSQIQSWTPDKFLQYCMQRFDIKMVACGQDFRFGKDAVGDVNFLQQELEPLNVLCKVIPSLNLNGQKVSSTFIKEGLRRGDLKFINECLGESFKTFGKVIHGKGMGKLIAPTINMLYPVDKQQLPPAVYGTYTCVQGCWYKSITNFGTQPTFGGEKIVVETHILNFDKDIYGEYVEVRFEKKLREIIKFENLQKLKLQVLQDIKAWDNM